MLRERGPDLIPGTGDDVEHALRQMARADLRERERRERRVRGGLQHDGVARDERGRDLPRRDEDRDVPWHDRGDDAERLAQGVREPVLSEGDRLALQLSAQATEVAEEV